jgi:4-amino-4-deoxy-L-arabinose transferase-like glycosyltransferase
MLLRAGAAIRSRKDQPNVTATSPGIAGAHPRHGNLTLVLQRPLARLRAALGDWSVRAAAGVGLLSAILYIWNLTASGFANAYYSAAALAASQSWTAWFFGSLDAGNFITVDKPPLATMVMGLSVRLFGLSSWSILLPEALLGVGSVLLLFDIVRRQFGTVAATIAGVVMAFTPVAVLMFRYDHPDALLVFLMLVGAWAVQRAIENGRHRWLVLAGVSVGLAFLTKYLQGFLVGPVFVLSYAIAANASVRRRLAGVAIFSAAALLTAGAWIAAVQLTPESLRPFIGGSTNNSVLDLVLGYDGLGRIFGGSAGNGQGGASFSGAPGLLRLFNAEFGGQISWLLPFAAIAVAIGLIVTIRSQRTDLGRAGYLIWGGWLAVHALVFSYMSGIVHSYYAVAMAPAVAALVGAGVVALWRIRDRFEFGGLAFSGLILLTVAWAYMLLGRSPDFVPWLAPVVIALGLSAAAFIAVPVLRERRLGAVLGAVGLAAMLAGPTAFSLATVATAYSGSIVAAGPSATVADVLSGTQTGGAGGGTNFAMAQPGGGSLGTPPSGSMTGGFGNAAGVPGDGNTSNAPLAGGATGASGADGSDSALAAYLVANRGSATWVVAVSDAMSAAQLELSTGAPVMAMGGWSGSDNAITLDQFKADVAAGKLRFVIVSEQSGGPNGGSSAIAAWVVANGKAVTISGSSATVYDLSGAASAG